MPQFCFNILFLCNKTHITLRQENFVWAKKLLFFRMMLGLRFRYAAVKLNVCFSLFVGIDGKNVPSSNMSCCFFPCKKIENHRADFHESSCQRVLLKFVFKLKLCLKSDINFGTVFMMTLIRFCMNLERQSLSICQSESAANACF